MALWHDVEETLTRCDPELYDLPFAELVARLEPLAAGASKRAAALLTSGEYRSARKQIKQHLREGVKLSGPEMHSCVVAAAEQCERWASLVQGSARPSSPTNLSELKAAYTQLAEELTALAVHVGREVSGSRGDVVHHLDGLLSDTATLGRLPELHRLRVSLRQHGVSELMDDLSARGLSPAAAVQAFEHAWLMSFIEHVQLSDDDRSVRWRPTLTHGRRVPVR